MSITVADVAREVVAAIATDASYLLAASWINDRYLQLASTFKLRHLRESADVLINGGGVVFDLASDVQFYSRVRYYNGTSFQRDIIRVILEELDERFPTRTDASGSSSTTGPYVYADIGLKSDGTVRQIEIYPAPQKIAGEKLVFNYYKKPTALSVTSNIPYGIDRYALREGALIDLYRYEQAKAIREGILDAAASWANALKEQEAKWLSTMSEIYKADLGSNDVIRYSQI